MMVQDSGKAHGPRASATLDKFLQLRRSFRAVPVIQHIGLRLRARLVLMRRWYALAARAQAGASTLFWAGSQLAQAET